MDENQTIGPKPPPLRDINKVVREGIDNLQRVVGVCKQCGKELRVKNNYRTEPAVYDSQNKELRDGLFHPECATKQYKDTTKIMLSEIKALQSQIETIFSLVRPQREPEPGRAGTTNN